MNLENVIEDSMCFVSIFLKKFIYWISLLASPLLHILGATFLQLLLTSSVAMFSSSFFFSIVPTPKQVNFFTSSVQEFMDKPEQDQEKDQVQGVTFLNDSKSSVTFIDDLDYSAETTVISDDGSISDEESLIELSLPSGYYVGHFGNKIRDQDNINIKGYDEKNKMDHNLQKNIQDLGFSELLTEFNDTIEEDNLIEIDISIGSIKYSRFEVAA